MANLPRKPKSLLAAGTKAKLGQRARVQLWVRSRQPWQPRLGRWGRWLNLTLIALLAAGAVLLLSLSLRWGTQLMLNPEALPWLQALLFQHSPGAVVAPLSLSQLQAQTAAAGRFLGPPLPLGSPDGSPATEFWLLPVQSTEAGPLLELQLYQLIASLPQPQLRLAATLPVAPLAAAAVLAPLQHLPQPPLAGQQQLPLTALRPLSGPAPGIWLTLEGSGQYSGLQLRYGQLVHVDLAQRSLIDLAVWSSPVSRLPQWGELDGREPVDLWVDETVGLEPALHGYRLQQRRGLGPAVQLLPVDLAAVPPELADDKGAYRQALALARAGLWSLAGQQLQVLKSQLPNWSATAEAQLQLVRLHAERTDQQAERRWSIPSQQILASLVDGRWEAALKQLESSPSSQEAMLRLLANDKGRLWNRVVAARHAQPDEPAVLVWGGLILKAQQDQSAALAWLAQQQASAAARSRFWQAANRQQPKLELAANPAQALPPAAETPVAEIANQAAAIAPLQAWVGTALPVAAADLGQWQPIGPPPAGRLNWYEIEVLGWQQRDSWQPAASGQAASIALVSWPQSAQLYSSQPGQPQTLSLVGLQLVSSQLRLLAAGPPAAAGIVASADSLLWLDAADPADSPKALTEALQKQLQNELQAQAPGSSLGEIAPALAEAYLKTLDVSGDGRPDTIVQLPTAALEKLEVLGIGAAEAAPKSLILNSSGQRLYSDLSTSQRLQAVALGSWARPAALLTESDGHYRLQTWSVERRQFE